MNQPPIASSSQGVSGVGGPASLCPPFNPQQMDWQFNRDTALRWAAFGLLILTIMLSQAGLSTTAFWGMMIVALAAWVLVNSPSAKVAPLLSQIAQWQEQDPATAEAAIAQGMARWPLHKQVRLGLYHQLAVLRHGQGRIDESAAIIEALLARRLGLIERHRSQLLLMLTEARLLRRDLVGSHAVLMELAGRRLAMVESLQQLALRTRYEVMAGHDAQALADLPRKVELAEMLPADQCGAVHGLWAIAAARLEDAPLHDWLRRRAELMGHPDQLAHFREGRLVFGVERALTIMAV